MEFAKVDCGTDSYVVGRWVDVDSSKNRQDGRICNALRAPASLRLVCAGGSGCGTDVVVISGRVCE